ARSGARRPRSRRPARARRWLAVSRNAAAGATDCRCPGRAWHGPMGGAPMNSARTGTFRSALLVAIASWVVNSHAWAQTTPNPVMPPATPQPAAEGGGAAIAAVVVVVGLFMVIGVVVKLFDLKQKRESEAVQLQAPALRRALA